MFGHWRADRAKAQIGDSCHTDNMITGGSTITG